MALTETKQALIIEDEMEMRFYLMTVVTSLGFEPTLTRNGAEGLSALKRDIPDLIILDIMMPEKGGALVYQELTSTPEYRNIPLVIFSGVDRQAFDHYVRMLNAGPGRDTPAPRYYVEKSADPDYLKEVIAACMDDPTIMGK